MKRACEIVTVDNRTDALSQVLRRLNRREHGRDSVADEAGDEIVTEDRDVRRQSRPS